MWSCVCAAYMIILVTVAAAKLESWNMSVFNGHRPAFLKPLTAFWTDAAFLYATLRISMTCHVVTGLPTCCHWSAYMLSLVCLHVITGLPTCCYWSAYMLSLVCLHVLTGLPTCCHWSAYMLSLVCLHVVTGLPTCCHWSAYMLSQVCLHVVTGLPTCCHWSAYMLSLVCLHVVTGLPTCCHWSAYMLSLVCLHVLSSKYSMHHRSISQTVLEMSHSKAVVGGSDVEEVRPRDHSSFPSHLNRNQILCVGHVASMSTTVSPFGG